jgi:hypothetical protein
MYLGYNLPGYPNCRDAPLGRLALGRDDSPRGRYCSAASLQDKMADIRVGHYHGTRSGDKPKGGLRELCIWDRIDKDPRGE